MAAVPIYLGAEEVQGVCLGADEVLEAYLGEDLVYQAGPFVGLRVTPRVISFNSDSLTSSIKVKASESWTMTVPAWISASVLTGDTGETIVSLTATTQTAATTGTVEVTSTNYSASASANYNIYTFINYVQTDGYCWFDTNVIPTQNTEVECDFSPLSQTGAWNVFYGSQSRDDGPDSFQIRRADKYFSLSVFVGSPQKMTSNIYAYGDWLHTILNKTDLRYSVNSGTTQTLNVNSTGFTTSTLPIYIGAVNNPQWYPTGDSVDDYRPGRGSVAKYGEMKIYESGVLVADLKPAQMGNSIGFYDTVADVFRPNLGTGTPIGG